MKINWILFLILLSPNVFADSNALGSVAIGSYNSCPSSSLATDACYNLTVTCPNVPDLVAHVKVTEPASSPSTGTLVMFSGGDGTGFYETTYSAHAPSDIMTPARNRGWRLIQVAWATDVFAGPTSMLASMCRGATLLKAIHDQTSTPNKLHQSGTLLAATGNSGGASVISYAMTRYGGGDWMDCVVPTSGPPIANLSHGCMGNLNLTWIAACHAIKNGGSCGYVNPSWLTIDGAYNGITACQVKAAGGGLYWERDSLINGGATTVFPKTRMEFIFAYDGDSSEAVQIGTEAAHSITNSIITNVLGGDTGHDLPNYTNGAAALNTALSNCSYLH